MKTNDNTLTADVNDDHTAECGVIQSDDSVFPTMKSLDSGKKEKSAATAAKKDAPVAGMATGATREQAIDLLKKYNQDAFHLQHAYTVEAVMRWFATELGEGNEDFWAMAGLLHDIDFEEWPEEHCKKAPELLAEIGASDDLIHAVVSHAYGICSDVEPVKQMEKVLFAADELTGLIGAAALMRPSKSCTDMELKSLKKKFKDKRFAAGCDRETIKKGAEILGWELDELLEKTLKAMAVTEEDIKKKMEI